MGLHSIRIKLKLTKLSLPESSNYQFFSLPSALETGNLQENKHKVTPSSTCPPVNVYQVHRILSAEAFEDSWLYPGGKVQVLSDDAPSASLSCALNLAPALPQAAKSQVSAYQNLLAF